MHAAYEGVGPGIAIDAEAVRLPGGRWRWPGRRTALRLAGSLHRALYQASYGRIGRTLRGGRVLLLTTTGRKTKRARTWPLCYVEAGDDIVVVASAAGAARHPAWYLNLRSDPKVSVQVGGRRRAMIARPAEGRQRAQLWDRLVEQYPVLTRYQGCVDRVFPVIVLRPAEATVGMAGIAATF